MFSTEPQSPGLCHARRGFTLVLSLPHRTTTIRFTST
jgi:hypothetical protein